MLVKIKQQVREYGKPVIEVSVSLGVWRTIQRIQNPSPESDCTLPYFFYGQLNGEWVECLANAGTSWEIVDPFIDYVTRLSDDPRIASLQIAKMSGEEPLKLSPRAKVYVAIDTEREYQEKIWSNSDKASGATNVSSFLTWMRSYLRKAEDLASCNDETPGSEGCDKIMDVVRKVVALGVACGEINGMPERKLK